LHILVLGVNYVPEKTGIGPLTADMCEDLVGRGNEVTMVTAFPHYPEWQVYSGYRGRLFTQEEVGGVQVRRGFVYVPGKPNPYQRVVYDLTMALSGGLNLLGIRRPDAILAISPPLQLALTALVASRFWGTPVLLIIKDIIPDVAISLGMLENPTLIRLARALERFCYRRVDHISVIGRGFVDNLLSKGVPADKLSLIPDWVDVQHIKPMPRLNRFRTKHGIPAEAFVVLYGGSMSIKQGLENALLAAGQLQEASQIQLYLVGEGVARQGLVEMAREQGLPNVKFLPFEPEEVFPDMLAAADVLLINQRADVRGAVLPCKLLNYMAAGRPVVAAVNEDSETATYVRMAACGVVVPPEQPLALAEAIRRLSQSPDLCMELGVNGRRFAEENFARRRVLDRYVRLIERLALDRAL
jgi:colanic acid biosynthesis glycosyl transferase WcaI